MSAKDRYERLAGDERSQFVKRAQHNALLTIPSLFPLDGHNGKSHLVEPYQGLGAMAVSHLTSRMALALLPAGRPYLRFDLPPDLRMETEGEVPSEVNRSLALSEQLVQAEAEQKGWRAATLMAIAQLIVAGNVLEFQRPNNTIRTFKLDQYVVRRDFQGRLSELIIKDVFTKDTLPEELAATLGTVKLQGFREDEEIELFTQLKQTQGGDDPKWEQSQWIDMIEHEPSRFEWNEKNNPYTAHRWAAVPGEDYGRSKVEEHAADLRSLEAYRKSGIDIAAMAGRSLIALRPGANAASLKSRIISAQNGEVILADPESWEMKSFNNSGGYQIVQTEAQMLVEQVSRAFLLLSAGQRNAERVTAAEIERDINEIEGSLGGVFTTLSVEMMGRRTHLAVANMIDRDAFPPVEGKIKPIILTGIEALSRERDVGRAVQAGQIVMGFGEGAVDQVKLDVILEKALTGLGFPDAVRSPEEAAQLAQQRQQAQLAMQGASAAIPQVAKEVAKAEASEAK